MKIQKKKWLTFAAAAIIATGVLGMTSLAAGRADLNENTGGPGEKASVDVSTGEKPGDTQERQQDQQTAVITQILAVAGTGDCNADISYYKKENGNWECRFNGIVEPNIQVMLEELTHEDLPDLDRVSIQYVAFKEDKEFKPKNPATVECKIDATKFYKVHCFHDNEYFDKPVIAYDIVKNDVPQRRMVIDSGMIEQAMREKKQVDKPKKKPVEKHSHKKGEIIEVDLHIDELLETTAGLDNADMLEVQMSEFRRVMDENFRNKGQKIVFIHGKGEGVLRKSILDEIKHKYKACQTQDASFREYGFGATLVTIH